MATNTRLVTFNAQNVTPQDDGLLYETAIPQTGIIYGANLTANGTNTVHIETGFGIVRGRFFEIFESDIAIPLSASGEIQGRIIGRLDLSNIDEPFVIEAQTGSLTPLRQDADVNIFNGVHEFLLATFVVNEITISGFQDVKERVEGVNEEKIIEIFIQRIANSQAVTEEGYALDARQANPNIQGSLGEKIKKILDDVITVKPFTKVITNYGINVWYKKQGAIRFIHVEGNPSGDIGNAGHTIQLPSTVEPPDRYLVQGADDRDGYTLEFLPYLGTFTTDLKINLYASPTQRRPYINLMFVY